MIRAGTYGLGACPFKKVSNHSTNIRKKGSTLDFIRDGKGKGRKL